MSLYLQSVIVKKELGYESALKLAQDIIKNKKKTQYSLDDDNYVFRNIPKVKFETKSLVYKNINDNVRMIYGVLK